MALGLAFSGSAAAQVVEISQACFPDFCVESSEGFFAVPADAEKGEFRIRVFSSDRMVYFYRLDAPGMPECTRLCRVEMVEGSPRAVHARSGAPMGHLLGPFEGCGGAAPFFIAVRAFQPYFELEKFRVVRHCR